MPGIPLEPGGNQLYNSCGFGGCGGGAGAGGGNLPSSSPGGTSPGFAPCVHEVLASNLVGVHIKTLS